MKPLPSNNFTDKNGDTWFCVTSERGDTWVNTRTNKRTTRTRAQIIGANVKWNEPKLYRQ